MRKFFLTLAITVVTASLQAITILWNVPNSEFSWDDATLVNGENVGIYFVYSQSEIKGGHTAVWEAANDGKGGTGTTVVSATTKSTSVNGAPLHDVKMGVYVDNPTEVWLSVANTWTADNQPFAGNGYFYLVVFNTKEGTDEYGDYAVSNAVQYTGNADTNAGNGIYDTTVDGSAPSYGEFIDVSWMGGTWNAAITPEPTALALLALGIAGLALRRKI